MDSIPFTERRNSITTNIDTETSEGSMKKDSMSKTKKVILGIVEMLHRCNLEVFNGYEQYHGLLDETCLTKLDQLVPLIKEIFQVTCQIDRYELRQKKRFMSRLE